MGNVVTLHTTRCAICGTEGNATELYTDNFDFQAFNPDVFSARRLPDRIHYRMVRCNSCQLVRSDPVVDSDVLAHLYTQSEFTYDNEVDSLKQTYGYYLSKLDAYGVNKGSLLEIGCGNGFFLDQALAQGYTSIHGVEPSTDAIAKASPQVRPHIVADVMRPGLFAPDSFDVVCMFQVFDHMPEPGPLLDECFKVLKPGGFMLCLNHNIEAVSARLLKDRSPIIDIEHTYLYSPTTIKRIFTDHAFVVRRIASVYNSYALHYLARLLPLSAARKHALLALLNKTVIGRLQLWVPLGNLYALMQKPR